MCMLKTLLRRSKQYQIAHKKQMIGLLVCNSDTLADSADTVCQIHVDYEEEQ